MTADTLPNEVDFVFCPEALPEEEVHRVVLVVEGMACPIPTSLIMLTDEDARRVCDRLNRRLGHRDRESWTAFAARFFRAGAPRGGAPH